MQHAKNNNFTSLKSFFPNSRNACDGAPNARVLLLVRVKAYFVVTPHVRHLLTLALGTNIRFNQARVLMAPLP